MDMKNLAAIRQTFAQTVFTHKVQEVACEFKEKRAKRFRYIHLVLVSLVILLLALQAANLDSPIFALTGIGVAAGEVIFLILQLTYNFEKEAAQHKSVALKYLALRDKYMLLITDVMAGGTKSAEITMRRNTLQQEYQNICDIAPQTGSNEYQETQKRLNKDGVVEGEQFTWSDAEIDRFLPKELRINSNAEA